MSDIEAVGDIVTGGAVGRAIEPSSGKASDGHTHEADCLNCGTHLSGPYCHACGQHAHVHRTLSAFFHDFLHGVLHFEGKIWRTLPLLAWKPGELTRRYIDGQRARFVSPIALFLFSVFLMFAVLSATGMSDFHFDSQRDLATAERNRSAKVLRLEKERAKPQTSDAQRTRIDEEIGDTRDELNLIRGLRAKGVETATLPNARATFSSDAPVFEKAYKEAKKNPDLLLYKMKSNSYKWSWAIIPLSVPFLWLLFPFSRRFRLYDHTVFVTYSVAFASLLVSLGIALGAVGIAALGPLMILVPPVHIYRQLRGAYDLGRFAALWRAAVLVIVALAVLGTFLLLMLSLGVAD